MRMDQTDGSQDMLRGRRVLIVEDETLVAMLLEDMVGELGAEVAGRASRLSRALELAEDPGLAIDAAILDVNLNGEEAFPIAEALAARGVPFAFSTGYGKSGLPQQWRSRPVIQKPFTQEQIAAILAQALGFKDGAGSATESSAARR